MKINNDNSFVLLHHLKERQKELQCLYEISASLKNIEEPVDILLGKVIDIIPEGFQYPNICRAQISVDNVIAKHDDLVETELKYSAKIIVDGNIVGEIHVVYIKKIKNETLGVFLKEEKRLIDAIANEIGQYLTITHYRNLAKANKALTDNVKVDLSIQNWLLNWELNESQIKKICSNKIEFNKDEIILKQGTKSSYVLLLTNGLIKVSVGNLRGKNFIFKLCKPYEFIGLNSVLSSTKWDYSASAIVRSSGYIVDYQDLESFFLDNRAFKNNVISELGKSNELLYQKLNILVNRQALGRLTNSLLYLWKEIFDKQVIDNSISRRTIAELSGISTENAVRILSELKKDKVITINKKGIYINNLKEIETYSNVG